MLKLSNFCLITYNLQNTVINVIIIKRLLHLRGISKISYSENSTRITQESIHKKVLPDKHCR